MMIKSHTHTQQIEQLQNEDIKVVCVNERLLPANKLKVVSGEFFGRNIEANIQRLKDSRRPLRLKLRNKCSVVIIDNKSYEELLSLRAIYMDLVERHHQTE